MYCLSIPYFSVCFFVYQFLIVNLFICVQYIRIYKQYLEIFIETSEDSKRQIRVFILSICQLVFFQSFFFIAACLET